MKWLGYNDSKTISEFFVANVHKFDKMSHIVLVKLTRDGTVFIMNGLAIKFASNIQQIKDVLP